MAKRGMFVGPLGELRDKQLLGNRQRFFKYLNAPEVCKFPQGIFERREVLIGMRLRSRSADFTSP